MPWTAEQKREYYKRYRLENKDRVAARLRKWAIENPDRVKAKYARYIERLGPDVRRAKERDRYEANKDSILARKSAWKKGSESYKLIERNRIAETRRRRRIEAISALGARCLHCGFSDERALQFDHKTPLRRRENGTRNHGGCLTPREFKAIIAGEPHDIQLLCANCHQIKTAEDRATGWLGATSIQTAQSIEE